MPFLESPLPCPSASVEASRCRAGPTPFILIQTVYELSGVFRVTFDSPGSLSFSTTGPSRLTRVIR
jgi:hypothetical protein